MKRFFCFLLAIITVLCFCSCSHEKEQKVLSRKLCLKVEAAWNQYLEAQNTFYGAVIWGSRYVIDYCSEQGLDSYKNAVAAVSTVADTLEQLSLPECELTKSDYDEILACGADLSFISMEYSGFLSILDEEILIWQDIQQDMLEAPFWNYGTEYLKKSAEYKIREAELLANCLVSATNEIMLVLGKDDFGSALIEKYPFIIRENTEFLHNIGDIDKKTDSYLDELESVYFESAELKSIKSANAELLNDAAVSGDWEKVFSQAIIWDDIYAVINLPEYSLTDISVYAYDGEKISISAGEDLSSFSVVISAEYGDIPKRAFSDYILSIPVDREKYTVKGALEGDGACYISYYDGAIGFDALWEESGAVITVYDDVSVLCPLWYAYYKLTR